MIFQVLPVVAETELNTSPVRPEIVIEKAVVSPGQSVKVGIKFTIDKPWHIYYKEPGDAGLPTRIRWNSVAGISFGELEWPDYVDFMQPGNIHGKGYEGEVTLWTTASVATTVLPASVKLEARVDWLRCAKLCVQEKANLEAVLEVAYQGARAS